MQSASAEGLLASLANAGEVSYFLELIPNASLDPELAVETTVIVAESIPSENLYLPLIAR